MNCEVSSREFVVICGLRERECVTQKPGYANDRKCGCGLGELSTMVGLEFPRRETGVR